MPTIKIIIGFLALVLAWGFMFRTGLIFKLNSWFKEYVFNDQIALYSRRRLALLLFLLGFVALFSGIEKISDTHTLSDEAANQLLDDAQHEFRAKKFVRAINIGKVLTKADPRNVQAWEILANSYYAAGQNEEARRCYKVLFGLDANRPQAQRIYEKLISKVTTSSTE